MSRAFTRPSILHQLHWQPELEDFQTSTDPAAFWQEILRSLQEEIWVTFVFPAWVVCQNLRCKAAWEGILEYILKNCPQPWLSVPDAWLYSQSRRLFSKNGEWVSHLDTVPSLHPFLHSNIDMDEVSWMFIPFFGCTLFLLIWTCKAHYLPNRNVLNS